MAQLALPHQIDVFNTLLDRAKLYFEHRWLDLPIRPRFHSLIAGPTGIGKTTIASQLPLQLASSVLLETAFLRISVPEWMPMGAHNRGSAETFPMILRRLESVKNLVLFLDEIDKLWDTNTSWQDYARAELYDLLDGKIPAGINVQDDFNTSSGATPRLVNLVRKLGRNTFVVAAGTFQAHWETAIRNPIGFADNSSSQIPSSLSADEIARRLPRELINRFHTEILTLRPLDHADYIELARSTASRLPTWIQAEFKGIAASKIDQAFESQKGCRFVEEVLLLALQAAHKRDKVPTLPAP